MSSFAPTLAEDGVVEHSRAVLARHARTFRWASALLSPTQRDEAAIVYAFCRLIDDIADESPDPRLAREGLTALALEVRQQAPARPITAAFLDVAERRGFGIEPALHLLDGALSDLDPVQVSDDGELARYCYRVAGTVGLMMCGVIGVEDPRGLPFAVDLGIAMQMTNICRDVGEDAVRGRVYLPAARLRAEGVDPEDLVCGRAHRGRVASAVLGLLDEADRYYASGDQGMRFIPWRPRLAILVASRVYRAIGVRLRRRSRGDALAGRAIVPVAEKVLWSAIALARAAWLSVCTRFVTTRHDAVLHRGLHGLPGAHAS